MPEEIRILAAKKQKEAYEILAGIHEEYPPATGWLLEKWNDDIP